MLIGTIVNVATVTAGSIIGLFFGKRIKGEIKETTLKALGLAVLVLGVKMAFEEHDFLAVIIALVLGAIVGELINIELQLDRLGVYIQSKTKSSSNTFVLGFVTASVLFCVGSMTIIGSIKDGLNNDPSVLYVKSMLDGVSSIILTSTLGIGVIFSAIVILVYQGALSILASKATFLLDNDIYVNGISVVGGIIIVGIGLNMLNITKIKTANLLPALFIVPIYDILFLYFLRG
jgi:uncharacterized membrane protein YqgA involved in biofilm formation